MNTNALRQKILDLAIHGKLVKQDPADEPASVMLEKLRAEKEVKIAAGEIKRNKHDSYIFKYTGTSGENKTDDDPERLEHNRHYEKFADGRIKDIEDDIPFAAPEGWAWCRLGEVCELKGGKRIPAGLSATKERTSHIYIRVTDMKNNSISDEDLVYITDEIYEKIQRYTISKNDLYLTIAGSIGRVGIVPDKFDGMNLTENALKLTNISVDKKYLMLILNSPFVQDYFESTYHQVAMPKLSLVNASKTFIPLPPLSEQQRIVAKIETIFAQIDLLEQNKADLQTAVKQAKSKILDLAIRGKLVPQDPADEPASVMLEKLRAEKEAKIAAGEIKRGKNDSYIYKNSTDNCYYEKFDGKNDICIDDDDIPFELPAKWQWTKLGRICDKLVDGDHNPPKGIEEKTEYIMVSSRNINHNTVEDLENVRYLTKEMFDAENLRTNATTGDILFTSVGSLGRSCIYDGRMNICFQRSVSILNTKVYNKYVKFFFDSNFYQNYVAEHATGTAQMGFYLQEMAESFIAIPPISEQKRIVARIEEIFYVLDNIQSNLV